MISEKNSSRLSHFTGAYIKRWMEGNYDHIMSTKAVAPLLNLDQRTRYCIEGGLYSLMAYIEPLLPDQTFLQATFRQLVIDAPPELGRRIVKGYRETVENATAPLEPDQQEVQKIILEMDDSELLELLRWASETSPEERIKLRSELTELSEDRLEVLMNTPSGSFRESVRDLSSKIKDRLGERIETLDGAATKLNQIRDGIKKKRRNLIRGNDA